MKNLYKERLKSLLNNPRTGLKESSDTNKTRMEILGILDELCESKDREQQEAVEEERKRIKAEEKDGVSGWDAFRFALCAFLMEIFIGIGIMLIKI